MRQLQARRGSRPKETAKQITLTIQPQRNSKVGKSPASTTSITTKSYAVCCKRSSARRRMCSTTMSRRNDRRRRAASIPAPDLPGVHRPVLLDQTRAALGAMVCRAALQNSALSLDGGQARQRPKRFGMDSRSPDARGGRRAEKFPEKHQGDLRRARLSESFVLRPLCPSAVGMFAVRVPAAEKQSAIALSLRSGFRLKSWGIKQIIPHETAIIPEMETVVNQQDKFHTAKSESPIIDDYRALGIYLLNAILRQRSGFRTGRPFSSTARADVRPRWRNDEKDLLCTRHP